MKRTAKAHWCGDLKEGKGILTTQSGILDRTPYNFKSSYSDGEIGTNPEELLAAAHAGCYTMAVASILTKKGFNQLSLDTEAVVSMDGLSIKGVYLTITGKVLGISTDEFNEITNVAKKYLYNYRNIEHSYQY